MQNYKRTSGSMFNLLLTFSSFYSYANKNILIFRNVRRGITAILENTH